MVFTLLQWNACSLNSHGPFFSHYIGTLDSLPDVVCVQETWFQPPYIFKIKGYNSVCCHHPDGLFRGGCGIYLLDNISYRVLDLDLPQQSVGVEVAVAGKSYTIITLYSPESTLDLLPLHNFLQTLNTPVIITGDFNSHNTVWGSRKTDTKGRILMEFIEEENLVLLNDGSGTRIGQNAVLSPLDLTFISPTICANSEWSVATDACGSDHFPTITKFHALASLPPNEQTDRWCTRRADWSTYSDLCSENFNMSLYDDNIENFHENITNTLTTIAEQSIPKKVNIPGKTCKVWWNVECSKAVHAKKKAYNKARRSFDPVHYLEFKQKRAEAQRCVKQAKKTYWRQYCSNLDSSTNVSKIWKTVKNISSSQNRVQKIPTLVDPTSEKHLTTPLEVSNLLGRSFSKVSSDVNYTPQFLHYKDSVTLDTEPEEDDSPLNYEFNLSELNTALQRKKCTTPGMDNIPYVFLSYLPPQCRLVLLAFFNLIWEYGVLPTPWKKAIVVPILKPGKNPTLPSSYRPIALTSCLCKVMEVMINSRLSWYLEKNNLFSPTQSGFRSNKSTLDPLIALEAGIRKAFQLHQYHISVFLDFQKAYDMLWREGLLLKLKKLGIQGRMYAWIKDFLFDRSIFVRIANTLSKSYFLENGIPQGSVISPTLFLIMVNDLAELPLSSRLSQFADDASIHKSSPNLVFAKKRIENDLGLVQQWCDVNGFRLSPEKTQAIVFTKRAIPPDFTLLFGQVELKLQQVIKFLGLLFDAKLLWTQHINFLLERSQKGLNVMRCLTGTDWGCEGAALFQLYRSLIRSRLDYGCQVYNSAADSVKNKLDIIQHKALRICLGVPQTTSTMAMKVELGEPPLQSRRDFLIVKYFTKLHTYPSHPLQTDLSTLYPAKFHTSSFFHRAKFLTDLYSIPYPSVEKCFVWPTPPWLLRKPYIFTRLSSELKKSDFPYQIYNRTMEYLSEYWSHYVHIYTDGSKSDTGICAASNYIPSHFYQNVIRISNNVSVMTTELAAILLALNWALLHDISRVVIFSDSLSAIQAIASSKPAMIIYEIVQTSTQLFDRGIDVAIDWIPAHVGIRGNECADKVAKAGLLKTSIDFPIGLSLNDVTSTINSAQLCRWQQQWTMYFQHRPFYIVHNTILRTPTFVGSTRRTQRLMSRMRLGRVSLNYTLFLIGKHDTGLCPCGQIETVHHYLFQCPLHHHARTSLFDFFRLERVPVSLSRLLSSVSAIPYIIQYIHNTGKHHILK